MIRKAAKALAKRVPPIAGLISQRDELLTHGGAFALQNI